MRQSFNLIHEPWVPCIDNSGQLVELSLRDVLLNAHNLQEVFDESPLVTVALYRLLLVVLHRVFGPESTRDWYRLWQHDQWPADHLDVYFDTWGERFDLLHPEYPFYQKEDKRVKPKSIIHLIHSSGNNPTLFSHTTEANLPVLSPAQAARALVTAQAFRTAGLSGLKEKFTDGSCARGVLFLAQGQNLFETLALNLFDYSHDENLSSNPDDKPAWEMDDPFTPERDIPFGYLDYLTWQNSRILLQPETIKEQLVFRMVTIAPGLKLNLDGYDPMKHFRGDKKAGYKPLRFNEAKSLWRDSVALLKPRTSTRDRPPACFDWLGSLVYHGYLDSTHVYRYLALGMASFQAKIYSYHREALPLPLAYLSDEEVVDLLDGALVNAEDTSKQLRGALMKLATLVITSTADLPDGHKPDGSDVSNLVEHWGTMRHYWSALEPHFWQLVDELPDGRDAALVKWKETLRKVARETFAAAEAVVGTGANALKASVNARGQLEAGLAKVLP